MQGEALGVHTVPLMECKETLTLQKSTGAPVSAENRAVKGTCAGEELIQKKMRMLSHGHHLKKERKRNTFP